MNFTPSALFFTQLAWHSGLPPYLGYMGGPEQPDVVTRVTTDPVTMASSSTTVADTQPTAAGDTSGT